MKHKSGIPDIINDIPANPVPLPNSITVFPDNVDDEYNVHDDGNDIDILTLTLTKWT
jgi:hypothetical protein